MDKILLALSLAASATLAQAGNFQLSSTDVATGGKIGLDFAYNGFLKVGKLPLPSTATASLAGFMINANALDKASFVGTFAR